MEIKESVCQIALSVSNLYRTVHFYQKFLGYADNGGFKYLRGPFISKLQGYKGVNGRLRWLSDRNPEFQLEFFQYSNPQPRPMALDFRPSDIGYSRLGIWVEDFDHTLKHLQMNRVPVITPPKEFSGGRRVCLRDPDGVYLEIMEEDIRRSSKQKGRPFHNLPVETRSLTLSVPDLAQAEKIFIDLLGMPRADVALHTPEMEVLWGLEGAKTRSTLLWAGDVLLELVEYISPRGNPRPEDHHIGDVGLYHFALKFDSAKRLKLAYQSALEAGHAANHALFNLGAASVVYMKTDQNFLVEFFYCLPWVGKFIGFGKPTKPL